MNTRNSLRIRYLCLCGVVWALLTVSAVPLSANDQPPYALHFSPAEGFRPATADLEKIVLQLAGSLEHHGTPEPYLRHVMAENARIEAKYKQVTGTSVTCRPEYFTDEYLEKLLRNWTKMAPLFTLEELCRESGRNLRYAIRGGWNMTAPEMVALEVKLSAEEVVVFRGFMEKEFFTRADFSALDDFYKITHDKLTEGGKNQMSLRTWRGTLAPAERGKALKAARAGTILSRLLAQHQQSTVKFLQDSTAPRADAGTLRKELVIRLKLNEAGIDLKDLEAPERDALRYSHLIQEALQKRIEHAAKHAKTPEQATTIQSYLTGMVKELLVAAQMELELALKEAWLDKQPMAR